MDEQRLSRMQKRVRSPRSAAIAGIIYSILMISGMLLTINMFSDVPDEVDKIWLLEQADTARLVVTLMPFTGIAFLWFTGVVRDHLGDREDRFFSTIFLGSGIIQVVLLFIWGGTAGALFGSLTIAADMLIDHDIFIFGFAFMNTIISNYALRMAGVYMFSIGTIWTRTGGMPRWLSIITYLLATGFLLFAGAFREARFLFPVWVFVVSVYILVINYRRSHQENREKNRGSN